MDIRALRRIALHVAGVCTVENMLAKIVDSLNEEGCCGLARIWLIRPGDICDQCHLRDECPDQTECLHLVASAGSSQVDPGENWGGLNGHFRRFPLNVRKVGRIGATGVPAFLPIDGDGGDWLADPAWAVREGIVAFAGQPLVYRGDVLGVLGIFCRQMLPGEEFEWLRTFADHAAVAMANARTYQEVMELRRQLELERDYLREEIQVARHPTGLTGASPAMQKVVRQIEMVATSDATVLIQGESGTGKELVATAIHERSERRDGALIRVNCASIPSNLFESEFFGHIKGSFTGASQDRAGRFQLAHNGTLFLDEVGEIPLELQGKLLRVLQEGTYSRVGDEVERKVDVRVLAATNRDLFQEVEEGRFREDLYYRLTVFPIDMPPLRDRRGDIPLLANHFLHTSRPDLTLRREDARALESYDWPGNVRELKNVIERSIILSAGKRLRIDVDLQGRSPRRPVAAITSERQPEILTETEMQELIRQNIQAALEQANGKISGSGGAAEILGLRPNTLASRMKALGIEGKR